MSLQLTEAILDFENIYNLIIVNRKTKNITCIFGCAQHQRLKKVKIIYYFIVSLYYIPNKTNYI